MPIKTIIFFSAVLFLFSFQIALAHQPNIIFYQTGNIQISNPEISRAFYDELKGKTREYFIDSATDFNLYLNLLVPSPTNQDAKYSAKVFLLNGETYEEVAILDGSIAEWKEYYEKFGRDWYYQGPEFDQKVLAGKYKIEIYSLGEAGNNGKYVLAVGKVESFGWLSVLNAYWQIPLLKIAYFKTDVLQFFLTPFGIGGVATLGALIILIFFVRFVVGTIKEIIKHNQAKTMLLTSSGMDMREEIIKLLTKPAYDITVAFIATASKPEENKDYVHRDLAIMKEVGFNVEEFDIEGKTQHQVMDFLKIKDIIFVEGGNTFYLLKAMRNCNFEKVIRKLLKQGIVYIGVSAGSIVAGKTIETAEWYSDENIAKMRNLKGLGLVPFNIFCHYDPRFDQIIKIKIKNPKKRAQKLRILTDGQAILVQGNEGALIGKGEQVTV